MEMITITEKQYEKLMTIKHNAWLLAKTNIDDYKSIVTNLCEEYEEIVDDRIDQLQNEIKKIRDSIKEENNGNRH